VAAALNATGTGWTAPPSVSRRLRTFTRLATGALTEVFNDASQRLNVWELRTDVGLPVLLAGVHLVSKVGWSDADQTTFAQRVALELEREEDRLPNRGTVAIGDFNMSPFDDGMIGGFGFHALMTRELADRRSRRTVQAEPCRRAFYNPMWAFLAERGSSPAGTYYRHDAVPHNHYWYTLDQVLVRSELAGKVTRLAILDHDGADALTVAGGGWPDTDNGSDHLPVLVTLDI
jgi:endonuclease/exonuclease/phosphatase family metal-dependent hydrolase